MTAAVDSRVSGLAPMVIDMLNMQEQMQHQLNCWGKYSEQIADYTELQLPKYLDTPPGRALQCIVDPFAYRDRIEQPKLLIFGTNDRYWPIDACQNYWDELQGDKYLLYVPNQGHGIEDIPRVVGSLNALHQSLRGGEPLPKLSWDFETRENDVVLDVEARGSVDTVRGWIARSSNRDFRDSTWTQTAMQVGRDGTWSLQVPLPDSGVVACYAEVVTEGDQLPGFFSTNVRVFEAE